MFVNKFEHQFCCHSFQPVRCLFNETVMEAMWGLKNLVHVLVPAEKLELTKKDRLPMSQGLKWLMDRHGFGVKPEMVSEAMIMAACVLYDSDICERNLSTPLREGGDLLQVVSSVNYKGWDLIKLATALKIIWVCLVCWSIVAWPGILAWAPQACFQGANRRLFGCLRC